MDPQREREIGNNCGILLCTKGTSFLIDEYDCSMVMLTHKNVSHYLLAYVQQCNERNVYKIQVQIRTKNWILLNVWRYKKK